MTPTPYYQDSHCTIYLGDCLEIMPQLEPVDLVVTDPPYFQPSQTSAGSRDNPYKKSLGDMSIFKTAFDVYCGLISQCLNEKGSLYMMCDSQSYPFLYQCCYPLFKNVRLLIWDRTTSYNGYTWRRQHELILWADKDKAERIPTGDGDIIKCPAVKQEDRTYAVQKPIKLMEKIIFKHSSAATILDAFMGSGTTLIAAKQLNRKATGIEIEEKNCEIAVRRLAQEVINFT